MGDKAKHMKDCRKLLGDPFEKVHEFLDRYAQYFPPPICQDYHRTFRHNRFGYETAKARWGEKAGQAVLIHFVRDMDFILLPENGIKAGLGKWLKNGKRAMMLMQARLHDMGPNPIFTTGVNVTIAQKKVCQLDEEKEQQEKY